MAANYLWKSYILFHFRCYQQIIQTYCFIRIDLPIILVISLQISETKKIWMGQFQSDLLNLLSSLLLKNLTWHPCSGFMFNSILYFISFPFHLSGIANSSNSCAIRAMTYSTCSWPNFWPMQVRMPWLKGRNSHCLGFQVSHREGLNMFESESTRSGRRWRDHRERTIGREERWSISKAAW